MDTPQQVQYEGKRVATNKVCGVSILRAGETMEPALCAVCKDVSLGKILIQTNLDSGEPEVSQCPTSTVANPRSVSAQPRQWRTRG